MNNYVNLVVETIKSNYQYTIKVNEWNRINKDYLVHFIVKKIQPLSLGKELDLTYLLSYCNEDIIKCVLKTYNV